MAPPAFFAQLSLPALGLANLGRVLADTALRLLVVAAFERAADDGAGPSVGVVGLMLLATLLPALVLGPVLATLAVRWFGVRATPALLRGGSAVSLAGAVFIERMGAALAVGGGLILLGGAAFHAGRLMLLAGADRRAGRSPVLATSWVEGAGAIGLLLGLHPSWFGPPAAGVLVAGSLVAFLLSLVAGSNLGDEPAASDVRSPAHNADARNVLISVMLLMFMAGLFALLFVSNTHTPGEMLPAGLATFVWGLAAGGFLLAVNPHPYRSQGWVAWGSFGLTATLLWAVLSGGATAPVFLAGVFVNVTRLVLRLAYAQTLPDQGRGWRAVLPDCAESVPLVLFGVAMLGDSTPFLRSDLPADRLLPVPVAWLVVALAAVGMLLAWRYYFRPCLEITVEVILWPIYRIRGIGPGLALIPTRGPVLIVANHAAWFDPLWLAKIMPRPLIPIMTSRFYDLPVLSFLMRRVVHAIRVQEARFRRNAPEIGEAVEALGRGEVVVIFPEGWLKRKEEQTLRRFGRGVWEILKARPDTPVVACWIEGGWGSYTSYAGGPPTTNKKLDFWWPIRVAVARPEVLDPTVLSDHYTTRAYLMDACLDARTLLGLPPVPRQHAPDEEPSETANGERGV